MCLSFLRTSRSFLYLNRSPQNLKAPLKALFGNPKHPEMPNPFVSTPPFGPTPPNASRSPWPSCSAKPWRSARRWRRAKRRRPRRRWSGWRRSWWLGETTFLFFLNGFCMVLLGGRCECYEWFVRVEAAFDLLGFGEGVLGQLGWWTCLGSNPKEPSYCLLYWGRKVALTSAYVKFVVCLFWS